MNWIKIEDDIPEEERLLVYFFECTGTSLGFYFGRDELYPSDNNHVFGGNFGWLTGDVTHWAYIPDYPEGRIVAPGRNGWDPVFAHTHTYIYIYMRGCSEHDTTRDTP